MNSHKYKYCQQEHLQFIRQEVFASVLLQLLIGLWTARLYRAVVCMSPVKEHRPTKGCGGPNAFSLA